MNNYQTPYQSPYRFNQTYMNYQTPYQQPIQPAFQQDGMIPARFVSGREEAVASTVFPGMPWIFYNRAQQIAYVKSVDAQTGEVEFITLAKIPVQDQAAPAPTYVTVDMFQAYQAEIEKRLEAFQITPKRGKVVNDDV